MFKLFDKNKTPDKAIIYSQGWLKNGISYVDKKYITTRKEYLDKMIIRYFAQNDYLCYN